MVLPAVYGDILRVDLKEKSIKTGKVPAEVLRNYIGGRGLCTKILYDEVSPDTDPLSPRNLLIFATGPFAGTSVPCSSRFAVAAKSPLTGLWACADCGGTWGQELRFAGYDAVVFSEKAIKPVYVYIDDKNVEIRSAEHVWGQDTYKTSEILQRETDKKAVVACIGQAGENLVKFASIVSDGLHARVAGRAGLGTVMGSKNLKAIVVKGTRKPSVADERRLEISVKEILQKIMNSPVSTRLRNYGTSGVVETAETLGDLPIMNWRLRHWEKAEKISGEIMANTILVGRYYCGKCVIGCGRVVKVSNGKYGNVYGAGPEYETVAALGSLCLVDDLEAIAKANEMCNRYGVDTITMGSLVAFTMECFEKKLISAKDVGFTVEWGDARALIELINLTSERKGFGAFLAEGVSRVAQIVGHAAEEFAIHVKGLELPMHDPRCYSSLAIGYATANRGACHLEAFSHDVERFVTIPELGYEKPLDPSTPESKGELVAKMQNLMYVLDSLPICKFACILDGVPLMKLVDCFNAITGWELTLQDLLTIGERIFNLARLFNVRCGISRKDDTIPCRILTNPGENQDRAVNLPHLGKMLHDYYKARGWSEDGIPTLGTLERLSIQNLP